MKEKLFVSQSKKFKRRIKKKFLANSKSVMITLEFRVSATSNIKKKNSPNQFPISWSLLCLFSSLSRSAFTVPGSRTNFPLHRSRLHNWCNIRRDMKGIWDSENRFLPNWQLVDLRCPKKRNSNEQQKTLLHLPNLFNTIFCYYSR